MTDKKTRVRSRQGFPARSWLRSSRCLPVLYSSLNVFPVSFRMDSGRPEQIKRIYLYIFIYSFIPSAGPEGLRLPAFRILSAFPVCPQVLPIASSHNSLISYYNPEGVSADMLR